MHLIERGFNESIWLLIPFLILLIVIAVENQKKTKFYYLTIKGVVDFQFFKITYKTEEANKSKLDLVVISSLSIIGLFIKSTGIIDLSSGQHILTECALIILLVITYYFLVICCVHVLGAWSYAQVHSNKGIVPSFCIIQLLSSTHTVVVS